VCGVWMLIFRLIAMAIPSDVLAAARMSSASFGLQLGAYLWVECAVACAVLVLVQQGVSGAVWKRRLSWPILFSAAFLALLRGQLQDEWQGWIGSSSAAE